MRASLPAYSNDLGRLGLHILAFGAWLNRELAYVGLLLMVVAAAREWRGARQPAQQQLVRQQLGWHIALGWHAAWWVFLALSALVASLQDPPAAAWHIEDAARLALLSGFLLVAWHIGGNQALLLRCLALMAAGFLAGQMLHFNPQLLEPGLSPHQIRILVSNNLPAIPLASAALLVMLGILLFLPRVFEGMASPAGRWAITLGASALLGLAGVLLVLSQTRSMWLGLALTLPFAAYRLCRWGSKKPRNALAGAAVLLALAVAIIGLRGIVEARVNQELDDIKHLVGGDWSWERPSGSVDTRAALLRHGWQRVGQNPWFGGGPAAARIALMNNPGPGLSHNGNPYNDYHNAPLQLLLCYGIVGTGLMLAAFLWPLAALLSGRAPTLAPDLRAMLLCAVALLLLSAMTNYRLLNHDWRFWLYFALGGAASFSWWAGPSGPRGQG